MMVRALVVDLREVGRQDLGIVGGKGANLGELLRAELPVPAGFVVTTAAYDQFVAENGLADVVAGELAQEGTDGAVIREAFGAGTMPDGVRAAILSAYVALGGGAVAVRSSATAEDLPGAAFAGQQESYLNVVGEAALAEAVQRCWASLWTERAIVYRKRQRVEGEVALAVVVQRLVEARAAGVMFTANPVTGARTETVIDATAGLGEALVAGEVTPDSVVLQQRRGQWRIVERRQGKREVVVRAAAGGGTEYVASGAAGELPVVPDAALKRLAALGAQIERHFGAPQDIEWAWDGTALFILQARPITVLPEPLRVSRPARLVSGILAEMIPARPYPLEATTWGPDLMWSSFVVPFMAMLGLKAAPVGRMLPEQDGVIIGFQPVTPVRLTAGVLFAPWRLLARAIRYDAQRWEEDALLAKALAVTDRLERLDVRTLSWGALVRMVQDALEIPRLIFELRFRYLPRTMVASGLLRMALGLNGRGAHFGALLFSGVETRTLAANRALEKLAATVRGNAVLVQLFATHEASALWAALEEVAQGRQFLAALQTFLEEFGHREAGGTMLLSQQTWRDAPEVVLGMLQGMMGQPKREIKGDQALEAAREAAMKGWLMWLPGARRTMERLMRQARWFIRVREDTRFYATLAMPIVRRAVLEMGRRLAEAGILAQADAVFHLRMEELEAVGDVWPPAPQLAEDLRAAVARRQEMRAALAGKRLIDPRLYQRARRPGREGGAQVGVLVQGTPASPGVAQGPVRVIHDGSEFARLRPGDVLVAPYTNPGWTPLFQHAAAVVVDTGSAGSHAAITAREYGIPAVMATGDGTRRLQDGQVVMVDGGRGVVEIGD